MALIFSVSLLALCALVLPTNGQQAEPQLASVKTGGPGLGPQNPGTQLLPGPGRAPDLRRRCPRGKVYKECVSSTCGEYKCKHLYRFRERKCTADCRSGCFCAWPFFKNNDGRCVPFWQCYTYTFGRWFGRRPSAGRNQGAEQPGSSSSATGPGPSGAISGPQLGVFNNVVSQLPGGPGPLAGQRPGSQPAVPGLQAEGGWNSMNGLDNEVWSGGPDEYLGRVWGVPTQGYANGWSFTNGNVDYGSMGGNFLGVNSGPLNGIGGAYGNGIGLGSATGGFGSGSSGFASGNTGFVSGAAGIRNGINDIGGGNSVFGSGGMGLSSGNTGYGTSAVGTASGNVGFSSNDITVGLGGVTSGSGVFGPGNIAPGSAKGLA